MFQNNSEKYANGFKKCRSASLFWSPAMNTGYNHGQDPGEEQDSYDWVFEFFQEQFPERNFFRGSKYVAAVFTSAFFNLL